MRTEWEGVRKNQKKVRAAITVIGAGGPIGAVSLITRPEGLADLCHSFVLVLAYSVLQESLEALLNEKHFESSSRQLGALMVNSKKKIKWGNFLLVDEGRKRRNDIAHEAAILSRERCQEYVNAIEDELKGWKIL